MSRFLVIPALGLGLMLGRGAGLGAGAVGFRSSNGEWEVVFESKEEGKAGALLVNVTVAMVDHRGGDSKTAWTREFKGNDVDFIKTLKFEPIIAPEGDCFVMKRMPFPEDVECVLVGPKIEKVITTIRRSAPSYFESEEARLFEFDEVAGKRVIAVWDREGEAWTAFWVADGGAVPVTGELAKRWNEMVRSRILAKMEKHREKLLARKLDAVAVKLGDLAVQAARAVDALRPIDFEFLALLRDERDRAFLERLMDRREVDSELLSGISRDSYFFSWGRAWGEGVIFQKTDYDLLLADYLLAVFEGKAKRRSGLFRGQDRILSSSSSDHLDREERHHLGEVEGKIEFATPLKKPLGTFRIYLTPDKTAGWENRRETLAIEQRQEFSSTELQDTAGFLFSTVIPGKYFAKVIWDRRVPFTDRSAAGPGDYESEFVGPFEVKAGAKTNVTVACTTHGSGGAEYYRADETASKLWENMELTGRGLNGNEKFSAAAEKWIVKTNAMKGRAWINSIALLKGGKRRTEERDWPDSLVVYARQRSAAGSNELRRLEIRDEHGCVFKMNRAGEGSAEEFFFDNFPRSDETWRLVGFGTHDEEWFDFTVTNLVKSPKREVPEAKALPVEVNLGDVRMRVKGANPAPGWGKLYAKLNLEFVDAKSGSVTTNWFVMDCRFVDRHGNEMNPAGFCREENAVRVVGRALDRERVRAESSKDRLERMMQGLNFRSAAPFEFVMPRAAVGPSLE